MNTLLERSAGQSTTRISASLEDIWRNQFLVAQKQTPVTVLPELEETNVKEKWRTLAPSRSRSAATYDLDLIRFYEDIIMELERKLAHYQALALSAASPLPETEDRYSMAQPVSPSPKTLQKMKRVTRSLRISSEK